MPQLLERPRPAIRHTRAEYQALPEGPPYYELIAGELVEMSRPATDHTYTAGRLTHQLWSWADACGGEVYGEPNLYLPGTEDVLHPDLVYHTAGNRRCVAADGIYGVPDLVVEITSPSTARRDRTIKLRIYQEAGVPNLWLVDPASPVLIESFELAEDGVYCLAAALEATGVLRHRLLPECDLSLGALERIADPRTT